MERFAQTNLQLYQQMMERSSYTQADLEKVASAYDLALPMFTGLYRGSGKTLLAHLVGTASIVVAIERPATTVAAALLHAAHADGDFGTVRSREDRHALLVREAGDDVAAQLLRYEELGWSYDDRSLARLRAALPSMPALDAEVVRLRIANELEDLLDLGVLYCGAPDDDASVRKSAAWRQAYLDAHLPALAELARALGEADLAQWIVDAGEAVNRAVVPAGLRTGHPAMHRVDPPSYRFRRDHLGLVRRRIARARELGPAETVRVGSRHLRRRLSS